MEQRPLGRSRIQVSPIALGSWRTYEIEQLREL
jgi:aryl-alcohol dehydrogenase-like predicted oxidoreductase